MPFDKKNRKICPQNPGADALTIWHGAGILAKYLHTPVCWNWQTRRTQNPLVVTPYGFDPHHRHSFIPKPFSGLGIFFVADKADLFFDTLSSYADDTVPVSRKSQYAKQFYRVLAGTNL